MREIFRANNNHSWYYFPSSRFKSQKKILFQFLLCKLSSNFIHISGKWTAFPSTIPTFIIVPLYSLCQMKSRTSWLVYTVCNFKIWVICYCGRVYIKYRLDSHEHYIILKYDYNVYCKNFQKGKPVLQGLRLFVVSPENFWINSSIFMDVYTGMLAIRLQFICLS